ncbi:MAG: hypothetical protein ACK5HY_17350 [Parahaliea sp.]
MDIDDAVGHFISSRGLTAVLKTTPNYISMMRQRGIPKGRQYELQVKSGGVLLADDFDPSADYIAQARASAGYPSAAEAK